MKNLITFEEHYNSKEINSKIRKIFNDTGNTEGLKLLPAEGTEEKKGVSSLGADRIAYMDEHGITAQVISYPSTVPATMEPEYSISLCKAVNDEIADAISLYPGRYYALANLPLGDPKAAAAELERAVKELGFVGTMLTGHYHDLPYDDEHYFKIFEKAQELDVPVYIHPSTIDPVIADKYYKGNWDPKVARMLSGMAVGWHYNVGVKVLRLIFSGIFDKLPDLKILIGHWGELVSFYIYRTDEIPCWELTGLKKKYSDYFKENIYINPSGMLYAEEFRYCLDTFGADHITWGEDYPYRQKENIRSFLEGFDISEEDKEKIAYKNAEKLLHINLTQR